jgi:hypothetical protein
MFIQNRLSELPRAIGGCVSLVHLRAQVRIISTLFLAYCTSKRLNRVTSSRVCTLQLIHGCGFSAKSFGGIASWDWKHGRYVPIRKYSFGFTGAERTWQDFVRPFFLIIPSLLFILLLGTAGSWFTSILRSVLLDLIRLFRPRCICIWSTSC